MATLTTSSHGGAAAKVATGADRNAAPAFAEPERDVPMIALRKAGQPANCDRGELFMATRAEAESLRSTSAKGKHRIATTDMTDVPGVSTFACMNLAELAGVTSHDELERVSEAILRRHLPAEAEGIIAWQKSRREDALASDVRAKFSSLTGVGGTVEGNLYAAGVTTWSQLSALDPERLRQERPEGVGLPPGQASTALANWIEAHPHGSQELKAWIDEQEG